MIHVDEVPKPEHFDIQVRQKGNEWLAKHPDAAPEKFPPYWTDFNEDLAAGFKYLCGYCAMATGKPTVDHFIPKSSKNGRLLAYEWSNYRYADQQMNHDKGVLTQGILDPYKVEDGWFEVLLPNLEMIMTDAVPEGFRGDARGTLRQLGLGDSDAILKARRSWYDPFIEGDVTLLYVERNAPLIAHAIRKRLEEINVASLEAGRAWFHGLLAGTYNLKTVRHHSALLADHIDSLLSRPDPRLLRRRS